RRAPDAEDRTQLVRARPAAGRGVVRVREEGRSVEPGALGAPSTVVENREVPPPEVRRMPRGVERDQAVQPGARIAAGETLVGEVGRNGEPGAGRAESAAEDEPGAPPVVVRRREPRVERDERAEPRRRARPAGAVAGDVGRQPQPPGLRASKAAVAQRGVPAVGPRPGPRTVERESVAAQPRDVAELDDAIARAWILVAEVQRRDLERSHAGDR